MYGTCYLPGGRGGPKSIGSNLTGQPATVDSPLTARLLKVAYLLFGVLLFAALFTPGSASAANEAFQNGRLRFGTGSEASVNSLGNLQQPFYYDSVMGGGGWYQLTFANYPLNNAIAVGGDGTNNWNLNGTLVQDAALAGQVIDVSGFVATSGTNGYGTIVSTGNITVGGQTFQVRNTYTLGATDSFVKIVTRVTNTSGSTLSNVRVWVGTQDDYVAGDDGPTKVRGNIVNGVFTPLVQTSDLSPALQISSGSTGVLFYSTSPRARTVIDSCCDFANAYNQNPSTNAITLTGDGSYALFIRMNDLAPGQSDEIDWYYAAGELANLGSIVAAVGSASSSGPVTLTRNVLATPFTPVTISGGTPPYTYAISPALPAGLSFNTGTGQITGTPTVTSTTTTYTVTITDAAPATTTSTFDMTVKDTQSIFFNIVAAQTFAASGTFSLTATATSGLTVSFASQTGSVCSVSGTTVTMLSAGTCTIRASQAGNGTYLAATDVDQNIAIGQASQTISFPSVGQQVFVNGGTFGVSASASSGLTVSFTSLSGSICTVAGSTVTMHAPGTCTIRASQAGNSNYAAATAVDNNILIGKLDQTISFNAIAGQTYAPSGSFGAFATATSGLLVTITSDTGAVCSVAGNTVTILAAGNCVLRGAQAGNATYNPATDVTTTVNIAAAAQTINFTAIAPQTYAPSATFNVSATATSGLTVSFASSTPAVCTVAGTVVSVVNAGNCTLVASQAGNGNYSAAPDVNGSVTIAAAPQTINFTAIAPQTYAPSATFNVSATASSGLTVSFASSTPAVCTVAGTVVSVVNAGNCTLVASQAGNGNYSAAPDVNGSVTIAAAPQTINFTAIAPQTYAPSATFNVSATATSGLTVSFASSTPAVCTVAGTVVSVVNAGNCTLVASQAGNGNYSAAPDVNGSVTIAAAPQTINFNAIAPQTYAPSATFNVSATASSGLTVSFASSTPAVCTVAGTVVSVVNAGNCTLVASQAGNGNYSAAPNVNGSVTIAAASQTINFNAIAPQTFAPAATFSISATASSGLTVSFASSTPAVCTIAGTTVSVVGAGTCTLVASQAGNGNYNAAANVNVNVSITAASQTITFPAVPTQTFAPGATLNLSATASSGLAVSFVSDSPAVCSVSGNVVTLLTAGSCGIRATQAGNGNYNAAADVRNTFTVDKSAQTITFSPIAAQTFAPSGGFSVAASASSGLVVSFASDTPAVCSVSGTSVSILTGGTCTLRASQAGNGNYNPAADVTASVVIAQSAQTITFGALPGQPLAGTPLQVSASSSSGLAVVFSSQSPTVCSVNGATVTMLSLGTCTVRASQSGDINYLAAAPVDRSFTVSQAVSQLTLSSSNSRAAYGKPVSLTLMVRGFSPTGRVDFMTSGADGVMQVCNAVVLSNGLATCDVPGSFLRANPVIFVASYSGDTNNQASSANYQQTVDVGQASVSVTVNPQVPVAGRSVTLSAMITQARLDSRLAFMENGVAVPGCSAVPVTAFGGTGDLGGAQCVIPSITAGVHTYVVTYPNASGTGFDQVYVIFEVASVGPQDYSGMWWAGLAENGWGLSIDQHGGKQFVLLYVYDGNGKPVFYAMPGGNWNDAMTSFSGQLFLPTGTSFSNYDASKFSANAPVGTATITYTSNSTATLSYTINGISGTKQITRELFSDGVNINVSVGDMWWGGSEQNGWGMNISHQGSVLFPVWYTYDEAGRATWYTMPGGRWNGATYTGDLYYSTSSAWLGVPYDVRLFTPAKVGQISITFIDENTATVTFNVNGVVRTGTISRQPY